MTNALYYGDNLRVLRENIEAKSICGITRGLNLKGRRISQEKSPRRSS